MPIDHINSHGRSAPLAATPINGDGRSTEQSSGFAAILAEASGGGATPDTNPTRGAANTGPMKGNHSLNERALALLSKRQELIAGNIANSDTPNYKAVDIDVPEALRMGYTVENVPIRYRIPAQSSLDGNSVEMDAERAKFAENSIRYEFALDRVAGHYKMMMELFKSLTP